MTFLKIHNQVVKKVLFFILGTQLNWNLNIQWIGASNQKCVVAIPKDSGKANEAICENAKFGSTVVCDFK